MSIDWLSLASRQAPRSGPASSDAAVHVNAPSEDVLMADLERRLAKGQGFTVATLNLDHMVKFRTDPAFRDAYAAHSHVTADGNPIVWLSRLAGEPVHLVPGSELVLPVARMAARQGAPIALFGATETSLDGAERTLMREVPGIEIAIKLAPPMGFDPESDAGGTMIRDIVASGARVVFLALGAPKQEKFAARISREAPMLGTLSIGAGLDFLSGVQVRAPAWARRFALEWLWRFLGSPGRLWRRYRACFAILPGLALGALRIRMTRPPTADTP